MSRPSTLATLDSALGGKVTSLLECRRAEGHTASQIRDELRDEHNITVSERTVQRWLTSLDPERAA
jgi:intein-encoded DNA endonuclease-like protein